MIKKYIHAEFPKFINKDFLTRFSFIRVLRRFQLHFSYIKMANISLLLLWNIKYNSDVCGKKIMNKLSLNGVLLCELGPSHNLWSLQARSAGTYEKIKIKIYMFFQGCFLRHRYVITRGQLYRLPFISALTITDGQTPSKKKKTV